MKIAIPRVTEFDSNNSVRTFFNKPYYNLQQEEVELRSKEMKRGQEVVERAGLDTRSPRAAAKSSRLPIIRSKYEVMVELTLRSYCFPPSCLHLPLTFPSLPLSPPLLPPSPSHIPVHDHIVCSIHEEENIWWSQTS